jgi:hypothetical protein
MEHLSRNIAALYAGLSHFFGSFSDGGYEVWKRADDRESRSVKRLHHLPLFGLSAVQLLPELLDVLGFVPCTIRVGQLLIEVNKITTPSAYTDVSRGMSCVIAL